MILTRNEINRIQGILIQGRPYFRKDLNQEPLNITIHSSDDELKLAKKYIAKHLHPDVLDSRSDLTKEQKQARVDLFVKINSAIDDLIRGRSVKRVTTPDNRSIVIARLIDKYETLPQIPIINYYELFSFSSNAPSELIIESNEYKELKDLLRLENSSIVPVEKIVLFQKLCSIFNDFEKNVLQNKEGRYYYNQLLGLRTQTKEEPNKEINDLLQSYQFMLNNGFVNYYNLFNMDSSKNRLELLTNKQMVHLTSLLKIENFSKYHLKDSLKPLYESLCKSFRIFTESVLASDINKENYEKEIAKQSTTEKSQNIKGRKYATNYRYIFEKTKTNPTEVVSQNIRVLNKAIETGIKTYGVSLTVLLLQKLFQTEDIKTIGPIMGACFKKTTTQDDIHELYIELALKYKISTYGIIAEKAVTELLSRKSDVLIGAINNTAEKSGTPATISALQQYIQKGDSSGFISGDENTIGREKIMMEIRPEFIKFVLATMFDNKLLFLDLPDLIDGQFNDDESTAELVHKIVDTKTKRFKGFRK